MSEQDKMQAKQESFLFILQATIKTVLPPLGVGIIVGSVCFIQDFRLQMVAITLGLFMVEGGVWKIAQTTIMNQRKYHSLRAEVNGFLGLVRDLNRAALTMKTTPSVEKQREFETILQAMQDAVHRMADVAGKTDAEATKQGTPLSP